MAGMSDVIIKSAKVLNNEESLQLFPVEIKYIIDGQEFTRTTTAKEIVSMFGNSPMVLETENEQIVAMKPAGTDLLKDPLKHNCVICGRPSTYSIYSFINPTSEPIRINDCKVSYQDFCDEHGPTPKTS